MLHETAIIQTHPTYRPSRRIPSKCAMSRVNNGFAPNYYYEFKPTSLLAASHELYWQPVCVCVWAAAAALRAMTGKYSIISHGKIYMLEIHLVFMDKMPRSMIHLTEWSTSARRIETIRCAQRAQMNLKQPKMKRGN